MPVCSVFGYLPIASVASNRKLAIPSSYVLRRVELDICSYSVAIEIKHQSGEMISRAVSAF